MSQRGSFVTEYIYCDKCFRAAKAVLLARDKDLCSVVVPHWNPESEGVEIPIIAGKLGHGWSELHAMQNDIVPALQKLICHPIRIAVLRDVSVDEDQSADTFLVSPT